MYMTNLIARNKRMLGQTKYNRIYHIMNNMKFSKYILNLDIEKYAEKFNFEIENKIFSDGAYVFKKDNEIKAIYDYVNQTLFTNKEEYLEV